MKLTHVLRSFTRMFARTALYTLTIFALVGCSAFSELAQPLPISLPARFTDTPLAVGTQSYTVSRGQVVRTLEFSGIVRASSQNDLHFPVGGGIAHVYMKSGESVFPGDLIAELESDDAKLNLADAEIEAELAELRLQEEERTIASAQNAAQLNLEAAQLEMDKLRSDTRASNTELDIADHSVRVAQAELQQAELRTADIFAKLAEAARLKVARAQLEVDRLTLRAPITGTLRLDPEMREGNAVEAYTPIGRVVDSGALLIESDLYPADLELIATAIQGELKITTLSGFTGTGRVYAIPQPYGNGSTAYLQIAPTLGNSNFALLEGTNVVVRMQVTSSDDVIILPNDVIQTVAGRNYVVVRENDYLRDQELAIGLRGDTHTQVVDGLTEGMEIIAP